MNILLETEPVLLANPKPKNIRAGYFWLYAGLIVIWSAILWNAVMVACNHERLRLIQLPVYGHHLPKIDPDFDRFYSEDPDSQYWLVNVKTMLQKGKWRIRYTNSDNAPLGREMHWSSPPAWWLAGIYYFISLIHPGTLVTNLSWASYFASPILECIMLLGIALVTRRRFGTGAAFIAVVGLAGYRGIIAVFAPDIVGHHGWQSLMAAGALLSMLCGSFGFLSRSTGETICCQDPRTVRRWLAMAGFFSGLGYALGAPAAVLTLAAIVAGTLLMLLLIRVFRGDRLVVPYPEAWTWWGGSAAATSLFFYGVEYFPNHMSMRLETNHPLYSLAFFCSGLVLRNLAGGNWKRRSLTPISWMVGLGGLMLVPGLIIFGSYNWFILKEGHMARMHQVISEFQPYLSKGGLGFPRTLVNWGTSFLAAGVALRLLVRGKINLFERALLLATLLGSILLAIATLLQLRWMNLASVAGFIFLLATFLVASRKRLPFTLALLYVATVSLSVFMFWIQISLNWLMLASARPTPFAVRTLAVREVAGIVSKLGPSKNPIAFTNISFAPAYNLYGGIRAVGSFYWENDLGVQDWSVFFGTTSPAVAETIAAYRGAQWILQMAGDNCSGVAIAINNQNRSDRDSAMGTLIFQRSRFLPSWIQLFDTIEVQVSPRSTQTFYLYKIVDPKEH